ncbi:hypothetical protein KQX54_008718 [Cotesia glomerata]|uniref:Uncharacterized protein n=1 Tax=Cotesia glomerata TaxID=32391 RepID=A0AAV7HSX8_COTGL|nr:hypothetical protein KQX54_008718 [Cotesia glomerata]
MNITICSIRATISPFLSYVVESEVIKDADKDGKNVVVEVDPPSQSGEQTPDQVEQVSIKEVASKILGMDQELPVKDSSVVEKRFSQKVNTFRTIDKHFQKMNITFVRVCIICP